MSLVPVPVIRIRSVGELNLGGMLVLRCEVVGILGMRKSAGTVYYEVCGKFLVS
jgi:hypothetical protein